MTKSRGSNKLGACQQGSMTSLGVEAQDIQPKAQITLR